MEHVYEHCTRGETGRCSGCSENMAGDCKYDCLSVCKVCGGMEGSLLPECPGRWLTREEDEANYAHYCAGTGPFERHDGPAAREVIARIKRELS